MSDDLAFLILFAGWVALFAVVVVDGSARKRVGPPPEPSDPPWALAALAGLATLLALARIPLALGRATRNVDEFQYAATAAYVRTTGESLFSWDWNLSGLNYLYLLGSFESPFALVDTVTCFVVGATAFLLGLVVLRAQAGLGLACLTVAFYVLGLLRFEGLSSNKEPYVNLFLALYLVARLTPASARRQLLAGACLGGAVVMKEQALLFVFAEPLLGLFEAQRSRAAEAPLDWKGLARAQLQAALGFFAVWSLILSGFALHGRLGAYLGFLLRFGSTGGAAFGDAAVAQAAPALEAPALLQIVSGFFPLLLSPIALLGLVHGFRLPFELERLRHEALPLRVALGALLALGMAAVCLGFRFYGHYTMLLLPALAPLAALRAAEAVRDLSRRGRLRVVSALLLLTVCFAALVEGDMLIRTPWGRGMASGEGVDREGQAELDQAAKIVRERTSPDATLLVWGWRPEVFFAAQRRPAACVMDGLASEQLKAKRDLKHLPAPAAVVIPEDAGRFALENHPELRSWLTSNYRRVGREARLPSYQVWLRRSTP